MIKLRKYQDVFCRDIQQAWETCRTVLGVSPTGTGKTVCFSALIQGHPGASAAVVHRKEIVGQISLSLAKLGVKHRVVAPAQVVARIRRRHLSAFGRSYVDPHAKSGVISVQTLTARSQDAATRRWVEQVTLAIFDEGHHYVTTGYWAKAVEMMAAARLLFVTATPERCDGQGLGVEADGFAEVMVESPPIGWHIEQGFLVPYTYCAPKSDLDVSGIPLTAQGDLNTRAMRARVVASHLVGDSVLHYKRFTPGKRAIVFAVDVATADETAEAFRAAGVSAVALSGETDPGERDKALDDFEAGRTLVLVNVDLFDEGFDVPAVDAVIQDRPTLSLSKYLQTVGRALRPVYAPGFDLETANGRKAAIAASEKPRAFIIDAVRNWERHGMPDWPRRWSLSGWDTKTRATKATPLRTCLACTQPFEIFLKVCPYCGEAVPPPSGRAAPSQVAGDLQEMDPEALRALFAAVDRADMSDEDYTLDQIRRGIPPIGRPADLRRHQTTRHRRRILRELIAWWVGAQEGRRDLGEIHRRFYHRFGIDIASAFLLKADETGALIGVVQERFEDDLL